LDLSDGNLTEQTLETAALPGAPGRLTEGLVDAHGSIGSLSERLGLLYGHAGGVGPW
jgi:hypothetical protein